MVSFAVMSDNEAKSVQNRGKCQKRLHFGECYDNIKKYAALHMIFKETSLGVMK